MRPIVPSIDHRPSITVRRPGWWVSLQRPILSTSPRPTESRLRVPRRSSEAARPSARQSPPHRRRAAALIRQLGGRTEAELRRELDRFFAARPDLSDADRTAIARAMSRFRNQLLHHPRSTLLAAAANEDTAVAPTLLDVVRRLFGLANAHHSDRAELRTPASRPTRASTSSAT